MIEPAILKQRIVFRRIIQVLIVLAIFLMGITTMNAENDIFWQLPMGEEIVKEHHFPVTDHFSSTAYGAVWTLHEWLAAVVFYLTYHHLGWNGLIFLKTSLIAVTFSLFLLLFNKLKVNLYLFFLALLLAAMVNSRGTWVVFPSIFEYLFLVLTLFILEYSQNYGWKTVLSLSLLSLIWANTHSSFFLLTLIVGVYIFGSWVAEKVKAKRPTYQPPGKILEREQRIKIAIVFVISLITPFFTPNGFWTFIYPFRISFGRFTSYIGEYQKYWQVWNWNWLDFVQSFTFILMVVLVLLLFLARKRVHPKDLIIAVIFISLPQMAIRHEAIFALVALFLLGKYLTVWFGEYRGFFARSLVKDLLLILFIISFTYFYKWQIVRFGLGATEAGYPQGAAEFVNANGMAGNMFNHYNYGGYLIWKMPQYKVFIDGRLEMYEGQVGQDYLTIINALSGYQELLSKYRINFILNYATDEIVGGLLYDPAWKLVYSDKDYVILVKDTAQNEAIIKKYWSEESQNRQKAVFKNHLSDNLNTLGVEAASKRQYGTAIEYFRRAVLLKPDDIPLRLNLAQALTQAGFLTQAEEEYRQVLEQEPDNQSAKAGLARLDKLRSRQPVLR